MTVRARNHLAVVLAPLLLVLTACGSNSDQSAAEEPADLAFAESDECRHANEKAASSVEQLIELAPLTSTDTLDQIYDDTVYEMGRSDEQAYAAEHCSGDLIAAYQEVLRQLWAGEQIWGNDCALSYADKGCDVPRIEAAVDRAATAGADYLEVLNAQQDASLPTNGPKDGAVNLRGQFGVRRGVMTTTLDSGEPYCEVRDTDPGEGAEVQVVDATGAVRASGFLSVGYPQGVACQHDFYLLNVPDIPDTYRLYIGETVESGSFTIARYWKAPITLELWIE